MNIRSSKIIMLFFAFWFICYGPTVYSVEEIKKSYSNDVIIYTGNEVDNKRLLSMGVNLSKYDKIEFYRYIMINEKYIILLGKEKPGMVNILVTIELEAEKKEEVLKIYDWQVAARIKNMDISFIITNTNKITLILLVVYKEDASGNIVNVTFVNIDVFKAEIGKKALSINNEQIEETNIVYSQDYDNPNAYHAHADIVDLENQNKIFPAFLKINKILLCDVNQDGSEDILIWSKINLSRLMKDEDKEDFIFDSEKLYVMYFDPETMSFKNKVPFEW